MAQFLESFQWHGVKRGDAFAFYAGDIRSRDRTRSARAAAIWGTCTRTAMYTDSIEEHSGDGWRTAGQGSGRDCAGGIHHAEHGGWTMFGKSPS